MTLQDELCANVAECERMAERTTDPVDKARWRSLAAALRRLLGAPGPKERPDQAIADCRRVR